MDLSYDFVWVRIEACKYNKKGYIIGIDYNLKMLDMAVKAITESRIIGIELIKNNIINLF